jgi:SAM-dependent methyltransferase
MLSVVLYGRNDSHGYNLHKRAAISLNAIAELLTDADDEILFVDYNTPDDLPTFPEAIADTLTARALERLRVLRVRPEVHRERFAARTHLAALEPIARNVAIRRSNPANKWVLSTNTDMIFCPRTADATLTSIAGALADGFYHLPRFELPEGLWESLDRKDAPALIASAREWGQRFHLNEITYSGSDNVYDGPGDFQLFLRQDLFDIGGFHEEMIRGWHLDANIARRMRILKGKVSSALDHLVGYHCDHTRQASAYHKVDRQENDPVRFVDEVKTPQIPGQMKSWGLADIEIEAFSLGEASGARYLKGLKASVDGRLTGFLETHYVAEAHGRMGYEADHVLPYLLDLVSTSPAATRVAYVGGRRDTFDKFQRGWRAMGGQTLLVPASAPWLGEHGPGVERLSDDAWVERADLFIFEVGAEAALNQRDFTVEESARLWVVDQAFKRAVDVDLARQASGAAPRRVLVVNGIHNFFEAQVLRTISITLTPFSSRIRHGYIVDRRAARAAGASEPARRLMQSLEALEPLGAAETARLETLLGRLGASGEDDPIWQQAAGFGAEIEAGVGAGVLGKTLGPQIIEIVTHLHKARPSTRLLGGAFVDPSAGRDAPNRLARLEDWETPAWARLAARLFSNRDHTDLFQREIWSWERVSLTQNLMAALPPQGAPAVLLCGGHPERLAFALAQQGYAVDIADPAALAQGQLRAVDWRGEFKEEGWVAARPVGLIDERAGAIEGGFRYDAVLIAQNGLFIAGRAGAADVLRQASALLKPGGHLGLAIHVQPLPPSSDGLPEWALPHALTVGGSLARALGDLTGLDLEGAEDSRLTPRTLDRVASSEASAGPPALMHGEVPDLEVFGVWAFKKADRPGDWDALRGVFASGLHTSAGPARQGGSAAPSASRLFEAEDVAQAAPSSEAARLGSAFDALVPAAGLTRNPMALHAPAAFGHALAATAVLGRIPAGSYELEVDVEVHALSTPGAVLAVGVVARGGLIAQGVVEAAANGMNRLVLPLEIGQEGWEGVSVLLKTQGRADLDIVNLALR